MATGLDVVGQISILADDAPLDVEFRGDVIVVTLPDLRMVSRLRREFSRRERELWARRLVSTLNLTGLEIQVWVKNRQVARLAHGGRKSWVARWLGVAPLELKVGAILATLFGRDRPALGGPGAGPGERSRRPRG